MLAGTGLCMKSNLFFSEIITFNPIRSGLFSTFWDGKGASKLRNFKTVYAMATRFAPDSVRANSNHYRYCDAAVT